MLSFIRQEWREALIVILLVIVGLSLPQCRQNKQEATQAFQNLETAKDSTRTQRLADSSTIATQNQVIVANQAQLNALTQKIVGLENVKAQVLYKTIFAAPPSIGVIAAPAYYTDSTADKQQYLKVPASFRFDNEWYQQAGTILGNGTVRLDTLRVSMQTSVTFGDAAHKWYQLFKPWQPVVSVREANPYATIYGLENVVLQQRPPRLSVGLQVGYGILPTVRTFGPYAGVGLQWQILGSSRR
jgi:type II secretory pathway pseudopilin PulG